MRKLTPWGQEVKAPAIKVPIYKELPKLKKLSQLERECLSEWSRAGDAFRGGMIAAIKSDEVVMVFTKEQYEILNKTFSLDL